MSIRYSVRRDGENSVIKIRGRDLTQANLSNLFGLVPSTISLLSEDGEMETADASGTFQTEPMDNLQYWLCRGTPFYTSSCAMASSRFTAAKHRSLTTTVSCRTSAASSLFGSMPVCKRGREVTARLRLEMCMIDQTKRGKVRFTPCVYVQHQHR